MISGTPEDSLVWLLQERCLATFFDAILGSPTSKRVHMERLHDEGILSWDKAFVFIGDSLVDRQAADHFKHCRFFGRQNFAALMMFPQGVRPSRVSPIVKPGVVLKKVHKVSKLQSNTKSM